MRIANLGDGTHRFAPVIKAEIKRNRVKRIAESSHVGQQHDLTALQIDIKTEKVIDYVLFNPLVVDPVSNGVAKVISIPKIEPVKAILAEQHKLPVQHRQFIQMFNKINFRK